MLVKLGCCLMLTAPLCRDVGDLAHLILSTYESGVTKLQQTCVASLDESQHRPSWQYGKGLATAE